MDEVPSELLSRTNDLFLNPKVERLYLLGDTAFLFFDFNTQLRKRKFQLSQSLGLLALWCT